MSNVTRKRIKALRKERGLTQAGLDAAVGFAEKTISKIETGVRSIYEDDITALAKYFNVSISYLCGETENRHLETKVLEEELGMKQLRAILDYYDEDARKRLISKIVILYK